MCFSCIARVICAKLDNWANDTAVRVNVLLVSSCSAECTAVICIIAYKGMCRKKAACLTNAYPALLVAVLDFDACNTSEAIAHVEL